jgi:hypothetical protein
MLSLLPTYRVWLDASMPSNVWTETHHYKLVHIIKARDDIPIVPGAVL